MSELNFFPNLLKEPQCETKSAETNRTGEHAARSVKHGSWNAKLLGVVKEKMHHVGDFFQKVSDNADCKNHTVTMRWSLSHVRKLSAVLFKKLGDGLKGTAKNLKNNCVIRKLKDSFDYIQKCDLRFIRHSETPVVKEELAKEKVLEDYSQFRHSLKQMENQDAIDYCIELLKAIAKIKFKPDRYVIRNAMVAEVLTKHIATLLLSEKMTFPIPCFDRKGKPAVITYEVVQMLPIGNTQIPSYVFLPYNQVDKEHFPSLLIFRGTRLKWKNESDLRAIIENINNVGPAKGIYEQFKPQLIKFLKHWFRGSENTRPLFRFMGYSQGGVLGQRACVDFYTYLEKDPLNASIFFNSPAVEADYFKQWCELAAENKPCVANYLITRDLVSKRGLKFIGDVFEIEPATEESFLNAHLGAKSITPELELYLVNNEKEAESYSRQLVNQVMSSASVEQIYRFASKSLTKVEAKIKRKITSAN